MNTVAVTGGNTGIGLEIAKLFVEKGFCVAVCSRSPRNKELPSDIFHAQVDVRHREELVHFLAATEKQLGNVNIMINCAGVSRWRPVGMIDEAFVSEVIETSLLGTLWGCAAAAKMMHPGGAIVNVSSLAGKRGSANNSAYCAAKFAVNGITQSLAKELGPRGIRVNAVCPVYVETPFIIDSLADPYSPVGGGDVRGYLDTFAKSQTALGRLPTSLEVAEAVFFLSSSAASAITGQCINVDCGTLPQ